MKDKEDTFKKHFPPYSVTGWRFRVTHNGLTLKLKYILWKIPKRKIHDGGKKN